jgi:hypothetical protein
VHKQLDGQVKDAEKIIDLFVNGATQSSQKAIQTASELAKSEARSERDLELLQASLDKAKDLTNADNLKLMTNLIPLLNSFHRSVCR